jgi:hypothetical protein
MGVERTYIHARDLQRGDALCAEGRVYARVHRVRAGIGGCVFVEMLLLDGRLRGEQMEYASWVEITEEAP